MIKIDYSGKRYGHLTLLRRDTAQTNGPVKWWCRCDCGTEKSVIAKYAAAGRILTCGSCKYHTILRRAGQKMTSKQRKRYMAAVSRATQERKEWALSPEKFETYLRGDCSLCQNRSSQLKLEPKLVDIHGHYTEENIVMTCTRCRSKMAGESVLDHIQYINEVHTKITNNK